MKLLFSLFSLSIMLFAEITLPQNFTTDFHQTITNEKGKVIRYDGKVVFKHQNQIYLNNLGEETNYSRSLFKWSYEKPTQKEVCTDSTQLIVVDHDLEQVSSYLIEEAMNLDEILKVAQKISTKDYKATYQDVEYLIALDDKGQLEQINYIDNLENSVQIIFKNMNYNTTVNDTALACKIPDSYDMIKG